MEKKEEKPKKETPNGETPKGETQKEQKETEDTPAPEMSTVEFPSKEYTLMGVDKKEFNLKIFQGTNSIIFQAKDINDLSETLYTEETDFEEFHNLSRFFKQYTAIGELFTLLFETLKDNEISISKPENRIKLSFMVETRGKTEEITFFLKPVKPNTDNIALNLCVKVQELEQKLKKKDELIQNLQEEIQNIKEEMKKEKSEYSKNQKDMMNTLNLVKRGLAIGSQIIKYNEFNFIEKSLRETLEKNVKRYTLIYRGSRNGYRAEDFHEKCDGKNNTIVFIQARNGRRFGGFTEAKWDKSNGYKTGSKGFLFSLDNKEVYHNKKNNYDIYCYSDKGPTFGGGHDLFIDDNCNKNNENYDNSDHSYETMGKKYALAGTKYFYVEDYEVYQIDFE